MDWGDQEVYGWGYNPRWLRVMTDQQIEELRNQIAAYQAIAELLEAWFYTFPQYNDYSESMFRYPSTISEGHKIVGRNRWTPTGKQLEILEGEFDRNNGSLSKKRTREIADKLTPHGDITETNVYNWFQNRRARAKKKQRQQFAAGSYVVEAEPFGQDEFIYQEAGMNSEVSDA